MDVARVETQHILSYLNYLRTDYVPRHHQALQSILDGKVHKTIRQFLPAPNPMQGFVQVVLAFQ
jgi:hypothetical protein